MGLRLSLLAARVIVVGGPDGPLLGGLQSAPDVVFGELGKRIGDVGQFAGGLVVFGHLEEEEHGASEEVEILERSWGFRVRDCLSENDEKRCKWIEQQKPLRSEVSRGSTRARASYSRLRRHVGPTILFRCNGSLHAIRGVEAAAAHFARRLCTLPLISCCLL